MVTLELLTKLLQSTRFRTSALFTALSQQKITWQMVQSFFKEQTCAMEDGFSKDRNKLLKLRELENYYYDQWVLASKQTIVTAIEKAFGKVNLLTMNGEGNFSHPNNDALIVGRSVWMLRGFYKSEVMQIAVNHTWNAKNHEDYQPLDVNVMVISFKFITKVAHEDWLLNGQHKLILKSLNQCREKNNCNEFDRLGLTLFVGNFDEQKQEVERCWRQLSHSSAYKAPTLIPIENTQWPPILTEDSPKKTQEVSNILSPQKPLTSTQELIPPVSSSETVRSNVNPQSFFPNTQAQKALLCSLDNDNEIKAHCCPILDEVMTDPVIVSVSGISYERSAITDWINRAGKEPSTDEPITLKDLIPNRALKKSIEEWREIKTKPQASDPKN